MNLSPPGTCTTETWVHRSREQQKQAQALEKRTAEGPLPQPTKPRTATPTTPSSSVQPPPPVTFVATPVYTPKIPEGASSNPPTQFMVADTPNIFPTMRSEERRVGKEC